MHDVDPVYSGLADDIQGWRASERNRLRQARRDLKAATRRAFSARIVENLDSLLGDLARRRLGGYWPIQGEPGLRRWMASQCERGVVCCLPVVTAPRTPLRFWRWQPGAPMKLGVWAIPVPARAESVRPDVIVVPLLGFDGACHRLGNGGGFYDRTLAALRPQPLAIGVGFEQARLTSIYPQAHDVPMDAVVTEHGVLRRSPPRAGGLVC